MLFCHTLSNQNNHLKISLPFANTKRTNNITSPTVCAISKNLSLGFLLVIISANKNNTCPPSSAGIGNIFMTANTIERKAVRYQNCIQLNCFGKILPIDINPPRLLYASVSGLKISFICFQ